MRITLKTAWKKRNKLRAKGAKLWAEGDKLREDGDKLWAEAIISIKGNVTIEWKYRQNKNSYACVVDGNEIFEPIN
jgi:hypothetical protein